MSNTERSEQRAVSSEQCGPRRRRALFYCSLLTAYCLLAAGCRMDMQDQPKYKTYRAGDQKYGVNGASVRPLVEGTVPRRASGAAYRDAEDYYYTGKADAGQPGSGAQTGGTTGGVGTAAPNTQAGMSANQPAGAGEL